MTKSVGQHLHCCLRIRINNNFAKINCASYTGKWQSHCEENLCSSFFCNFAMSSIDSVCLVPRPRRVYCMPYFFHQIKKKKNLEARLSCFSVDTDPIQHDDDSNTQIIDCTSLKIDYSPILHKSYLKIHYSVCLKLVNLFWIYNWFLYVWFHI